MHRVGIMIHKDHDKSWHDTVISYAKHKNVEKECLEAFHDLVNRGLMEPWAALHALDAYGCVDYIMGKDVTKADRITH